MLDREGPPLGTELPEGVRFIGAEPGAIPGWTLGERRSDADLSSCVACGLCLPHCPTYRLTGEESASPRGRITAMRSVAEGTAVVDDTFASFMDLCLVCRACEDVCPSHVPFGRMMERARVQVEPLRSRRARFLRWLGLDVALPHPALLRIAAFFQPIARPFLPRRMRALAPATHLAVRAAPPRDRAARGRGRPRDGRGPLRVRAGPLVPPGEPGHDPRARAQRLAGDGPARPALLRRAGGAQRTAGLGPQARPSQRVGVRGRGSRDRERLGLRRAHDDVRRAGRGRGAPRPRPDGVPGRLRAGRDAPARRSPTDAWRITTPATRCGRRASSSSRATCCGRSPASRSSRSRTATDAAARPVSTTCSSPRCRGAHAGEGRSGARHGRPRRRQREPRLHDADRRRACGTWARTSRSSTPSSCSTARTDRPPR